MAKILEMKNITKYIFDEYGKKIAGTTVKILDRVNFDLEHGEVHVLMGENGAGKSTLMKVLGGNIAADEGAITLDGSAYSVKGPKEAREKGVAFIHQELNLCLNLDIAHNIFLGREPVRRGFVDHQYIYQKSREYLDEFGFREIDPKTMIRDLSTARQQVVEIVKALSYQSKILIMDEPTASLTASEINHLFDLIRKLKANGVSIIYISHRMDELQEIGDRLTVLRDGQSIQTISMREFDQDKVVKLMVGRTISNMYTCTHTVGAEDVIEVEGLRIGPNTEPIDLHIRKGEIVGMGGLVGSGRSELARSIFGVRTYFGGKIVYKGQTYTAPTAGRSIKQGIAYLSEDRKIDGLIIDKDIKENISLASLYRLFQNHMVNKKLERQEAAEKIEELNVICRSMDQPVSTLSGGNQQKVLFAKWLESKPDLLILDEPTRGIDVNAKAEIYEIMDGIAKQGVAIMMISSELPELIGMSDRIYVMKKGSISLEIEDKSQMTQERILESTL
ncbi:sugar ABC transporter ATP-binding protein [Agathobaculum sp. NTUH-O15-33]|uniref:sugar ABC transporter ATP-binding protein n=1 Tax=Agathobaculum sp. NTUH-O15-33 TaxID=3079302 RepID=UPI0029587C37|nr:sugar ABC transporter ATP-binding protein [Agathobaculum sp. NTUH-O15-33]WNX83315.1 sugar ABC transporter ATP-binding protein [Agathobaculum sp. NTUH-O15-33]